MNSDSQFGFVAIVGRPNVGKSTLLNQLLGKKISITSRKPQTTRQRILGIKTMASVQVAYVDTPGLLADGKSTSHHYLNRIARHALQEVNIVLFVVDVLRWQPQDDWIIEQFKDINLPVIIAVNKIDRLTKHNQLLPFLEATAQRFDFEAIVPISAKKGEQLSALEQRIVQCLPTSGHGYPPDQWTDHNDRFIAAEIIREKLFRLLGKELPYVTQVSIDAFEESDTLLKIATTIWTEKASQKAIIIGKGGNRLKTIASNARQDMEHYFGKKVFLDSWVKTGKPKDSGIDCVEH